MQDGLRVAVIGTGWWATTTHIPALLANPHVKTILLCDRNLERVTAAASAFHLTHAYTDHRELLKTERPDAVVIATSHASHFSLAYDFLAAGIPALVEKPLTLRASEAKALSETAHRNNCALLTGYPWNFTPHARRVREIITGGRIGKIQFVNCVFNSYCAHFLRGEDHSEQGRYAVHGPGDIYSRKEESGGGHGHLQITHAAGLLFFVTGLRLQSIRARMENHGLALDLVDAMMVEFEGGGLGLVGGTSNAFISRMELQVYGSEGSVLLDMHTGQATVRFADGTSEEIAPTENIYPQDAPSALLIEIARGAEIPTFSEEGWRAVELLEAAYRSAEADGKPVSLQELYTTPFEEEPNQ